MKKKPAKRRAWNSTLPAPSKPLQRGSRPVGRGKRPPRINAKRRKAERLRSSGCQTRRNWLHEQPCVIMGIVFQIEEVHVKTGGTGRKADAKWTVPMCASLHRMLHHMGVKTFEATYGVDLVALAEKTEAAWQSFSAEKAA